MLVQLPASIAVRITLPNKFSQLKQTLSWDHDMSPHHASCTYVPMPIIPYNFKHTGPEVVTRHQNPNKVS